MSKISFLDLDADNSSIAIDQIWALYKKTGYKPEGKVWNQKDHITLDMDRGNENYNPDEHYSFFMDEYGDVTTKIG